MRAVLGALVLVVAPAAHAQLWTDATDETIGETAEWSNKVELADINGDGNVDILFANGGSYNEPGDPEPNRVFLGTGGGSFEEATDSVFGPTADLSRVIKARDLNGDGFADIVVGGAYQTQTRLFRGSASGQFTEVTATHLPAVAASIGDLEIGDVDNDGDLDLVLADWGPGDPCTPMALACSPDSAVGPGGRVMLWLNRGDGSFVDATDAMPDSLVQWSWDLELVDTDNDYDLDVVIACKACPGSFLYHNDGAGSFTDESSRMPAFTNNYEFEVADFDGDGFMDLVTINDGVQVSPDNVFDRAEHIFRGDGTGGFIDATAELWPASANIGADDNAIVVLDADSDGDPDFLIGSLDGSDRLLINDGRGHLSLDEDVVDGPETPGTLGIAVADLDGDGRLDLVESQGELAETEHVYLGTGIAVDSAAPVITLPSTSSVVRDGKATIRARIHDNKTPNKPHDWQSVRAHAIVDGAEVEIEMQWYGENLWRADVDVAGLQSEVSYRLCAVDAAGNETCTSTSELSLASCDSCDGGRDELPKAGDSGCRVGPGQGGGAWLALLGLLLAMRRRRRARH